MAAAFIYPQYPGSQFRNATGKLDWMSGSAHMTLQGCARVSNPLQEGSILISLSVRVFAKWARSAKQKPEKVNGL